MGFQRGGTSWRWIIALIATTAVPAAAAPFAYIATAGTSGLGGNVLTMIDTADGTIKDTIDFSPFGHPHSATVSADGKKVYVSTQVGASVCVVDALTNVVTKRIYFTAHNDFPMDSVLSPDGSKLYVATGLSKISIIDTTSEVITDTIIDTSGDYTDRLALHPSGARLYVTHAASGIAVIDTAAKTQIAGIAVNAADIRVHPDGHLLYAAIGSSLVLIDTLTNDVIDTLPTTCAMRALALNADGSRLYGVCDNGSLPGKLNVINTLNHTEMMQTEVGIRPVAVRISQDGTQIYVLNQLSESGGEIDFHGTASVIDAATHSVLRTIPLGFGVEGKGDFLGPNFTCGNGSLEPGETCDDGNTVDDATCRADCQSVHDAVIFTRPPLNVTVPPGKFIVTRRLIVKVQNGLASGGAPLALGLSATTDCAPGTTVIWPADFGGGASTVQLAPGRKKSAKLTVQFFAGSGSGFSTFNKKAPNRCTVSLVARAVPHLGTIDLNPSNNLTKMELNVIDRNDAEQTSLHETVLQSLKPKVLKIAAAQAAVSKQVYPKVGNADYGSAESAAAHPITVTQIGGDCPAGVVGAVDFSTRQSGSQNSVNVGAGAARSATVLVNASRDLFPLATATSPQRCTATFAATGPSHPDPSPSNNLTTLTVDVFAK